MFIKESDLIDPFMVGERINLIRESFDCTMEQFGRLVGGTSKAAVYNWEHGKRLPNKESLELIAILGKTTSSILLYGVLEHFIASLFNTDSKTYHSLRSFYIDFGRKELVNAYELAPLKTKEAIIQKVIEKTKKNKWSYSDLPHIADTFLIIADKELGTQYYMENVPTKISDVLSFIEKQNLSDEEVDLLLNTVRDYFQ
ncbi:helix-turn-helix domain-containing protein [Enterococcus xiangfangensis]|uniref:helix-turn-helix domain-containing protein n=1 Tax=Enterococcus xiangfangensis TaxID=1296537 RepID=UPI0010F87A3E|nr:helix-turn-helix transcriptional regulator [Enterococcus xiangfangensis]MBM7712854.1 transcriptional regulator with XRE-family HTH domain [Enterococcus xiangfangensis]